MNKPISILDFNFASSADSSGLESIRISKGDMSFEYTPRKKLLTGSFPLDGSVGSISCHGIEWSSVGRIIEASING